LPAHAEAIVSLQISAANLLAAAQQSLAPAPKKPLETASSAFEPISFKSQPAAMDRLAPPGADALPRAPGSLLDIVA
jgi:hypothetical protein